MKSILFLSYSLLFISCSSTNPTKIPEFDNSQIPALELKTMSPRSVVLRIKNNRPINHTAGNSYEVETAVYATVENSLMRGGVKIEKSKNTLNILLDDCPGTEEGLECVNITANLKTSKFSISSTAAYKNGYKQENRDQYSFGDIDIAYQNALKIVVENLELKLKDLD
jgi:hypothetical protein